MRSNTAVKDNFKSKNYPKNRKPRFGSNFPWTSDPIGRYIKTAIGLYGDEVSGASLEAERNFKAQGVGGHSLMDFINAKFPEFPEYYFLIRGKLLTPSILQNRYHKQYYDNKASRELRGRRSGEHYMSDSRLRPLISLVDGQLKQGKPISLNEIRRVMEAHNG